MKNVKSTKQYFATQFIQQVLGVITKQLKVLGATEINIKLIHIGQNKYLDEISLPGWFIDFKYKGFKYKLTDDGWLTLTHSNLFDSIPVNIENIGQAKLDKVLKAWNKMYFEIHGYKYTNNNKIK